MMTYLRSTFNVASGDGSVDDPSQEGPSVALNFLLALTSAEVNVTNSAMLRLNTAQYRTAGFGQFSVVEIGRIGPEKRTVAVKHSRSLSKPLPQYTKDAFTRHFEQFCLELRILGHEYLAKHPNIVKLLGICVDDGLESPLISLILDYSAYGSLNTFLQSCDPVMHDDGRMNLGLQAAKGLEALHQLKICHGDVKTQNTLVFRESDGWCVKLSDFGQSLISRHDVISGYYGVLTGTPLYNAPEIRGGIGLQDNIHSIEQAIMTDIFSFGLLLWEVLKHGQRFTKGIWNTGHTLDTEKEETILHALRLMPSGELLAWALESTKKSVGDEEVCQRVSWALVWTLRDSPEQRKPMKIMSRVLDKESSFTECV
jgi:serine/threonine protein kinase